MEPVLSSPAIARILGRPLAAGQATASPPAPEP
jgi:hypothetical protein